MAVHWQIQFRSLRANTLYTVSIYDNSYSGSAVLLKGGAEPFVTEEDNDENLFTPIRTQSGYIRIVDDGFAADGVTAFNWKDLVPDTDIDRPVRLTHMEGNVEVTDWQGFMQAQNFSGKLYGNPQEREYPIQCSLSVTSIADINFNQTSLKNFAYLLQYILNNIPSVCRPTEIIVQGGTIAQTMLLTNIDWQNFLEIDNDETSVAKYNLYQCLEEMCRFWGWTARTHKEKMYLICPDDSMMPSLLTLTSANLATMAGGSAAGNTSGAFLPITVSGNIFASADNQDMRQRGYSKSVVSVDINGSGSDIIKLNTKEITDKLTDNGWQNKQSGSGKAYRYTIDMLSLSTPGFTITCLQNYSSINRALLANYSDNSTADVNIIRILNSYDTVSGTSYAQIAMNYEHCYSGNWLELHADIYRGVEKLNTTTDDGTVGTRHMYVRIGVSRPGYPTMWLQGYNSWANTNTAVQFYIGNRSDLLYLYDPNSQVSQTLERFPLPSNLDGTLTVEFLGSNDLEPINGQRSFDIADFRLVMWHGDIVRRNYQNFEWWKFENEDYVKNKREYKANNTNKVNEELKIDTIYGTDYRLTFGYGLLINPNRSYFKGIQYIEHGTVDKPEQHLANRVARYWGCARRMLDISLRSEIYIGAFVGNINPIHLLTVDGTQTHPISINHQWRDDLIRFLLLDIAQYLPAPSPGPSPDPDPGTPDPGPDPIDPDPTPTGNNPVISIGILLINNTSQPINLDGDIVFVLGNPDHNGNYLGWQGSYNRTDHLRFSEPMTIYPNESKHFSGLRWSTADNQGMGEKSPLDPSMLSQVGYPRNVLLYVDGRSDTVLADNMSPTIIFEDGQTYNVVIPA